MTISKIFHAAFAAIAGFSIAAALVTGVGAQASSTQAVKNVVLVHGAWADGSSWNKVIPLQGRLASSRRPRQIPFQTVKAVGSLKLIV